MPLTNKEYNKIVQRIEELPESKINIGTKDEQLLIEYGMVMVILEDYTYARKKRGGELR